MDHFWVSYLAGLLTLLVLLALGIGVGLWLREPKARGDRALLDAATRQLNRRR